MDKCHKKNNIEYAIKQILVKLGNNKPNQKQLKLAESLLLKTTLVKQLTFQRQLTNRELICLLLAALGKRVKETAYLLEVMPSTVETWHASIKQKLESATMAQAVYKGIGYGYLHEYSTSLEKD